MAGPVESNFLFFMISLESDYYCWIGCLLLKLDFSLMYEKLQLNGLLQVTQLVDAKTRHRVYSLLTSSQLYHVYKAILKSSPLVGMAFRVSEAHRCKRHAGSLCHFESYILALVLVWSGWIPLYTPYTFSLKVWRGLKIRVFVTLPFGPSTGHHPRPLLWVCTWLYHLQQQ